MKFRNLKDEMMGFNFVLTCIPFPLRHIIENIMNINLLRHLGG